MIYTFWGVACLFLALLCHVVLFMQHPDMPRLYSEICALASEIEPREGESKEVKFYRNVMMPLRLVLFLVFWPISVSFLIYLLFINKTFGEWILEQDNRGP